MCSYTGVGLFYKMQVSFGTLSMGYGPTNHSFPVVFGETGSFYTSVRKYCLALIPDQINTKALQL